MNGDANESTILKANIRAYEKHVKEHPTAFQEGDWVVFSDEKFVHRYPAELNLTRAEVWVQHNSGPCLVRQYSEHPVVVHIGDVESVPQKNYVLLTKPAVGCYCVDVMLKHYPNVAIWLLDTTLRYPSGEERVNTGSKMKLAFDTTNTDLPIHVSFRAKGYNAARKKVTEITDLPSVVFD